MAKKRKKRSESTRRPAGAPRPAAGAASRPAAKARPAPPRPTFGSTLARYRRPLIIGLVGLAVIGGYYLYLLHQARRPAPPPTFLSPAPSLSQAELPGLQAGPAPWSTASSTLRTRLDRIGLPALSSEGSALHIHQHLDIFVDGRAVTVPADVGINSAGGFLSPIHTHDDSGIIHVESPTVRVFTLGQVFDVWGVRFTADCIGGYCTGGGKALRVFVSGKLIRGDPRLLELALHQEIVVTYGTAAQVPEPVPSSYSFPLGA